MSETVEVRDLTAEYERVVLAVHENIAGSVERLAELEGELVAAEVARRREIALQAALERKAAEEAQAARQAEQAASEARRGEARQALTESRKRLRQVARTWAKEAGKALELAVASDNRAIHTELVEELRGLVLHNVGYPWNRRLLSEMGAWPSAMTRGAEAPSASIS